MTSGLAAIPSASDGEPEELPEEERVREIGQLYQAGTVPGLAELLLDLEEDGVGQQVRLTMIQQLHRLEREARPEAG